MSYNSNSYRKVPDDDNMISKHTFLIIVISISKHCHSLDFQAYYLWTSIYQTWLVQRQVGDDR
jgi:hypothetical protein